MLGHTALKIIPLLGKFKFKKYLSTSSFKSIVDKKRGDVINLTENNLTALIINSN